MRTPSHTTNHTHCDLCKVVNPESLFSIIVARLERWVCARCFVRLTPQP